MCEFLRAWGGGEEAYGEVVQTGIGEERDE